MRKLILIYMFLIPALSFAADCDRERRLVESRIRSVERAEISYERRIRSLNIRESSLDRRIERAAARLLLNIKRIEIRETLYQAKLLLCTVSDPPFNVSFSRCNSYARTLVNYGFRKSRLRDNFARYLDRAEEQRIRIENSRIKEYQRLEWAYDRLRLAEEELARCLACR